MDRAIELFASVRDSYAFDRGLAVEARLSAGNAYEAVGRWPAAVARVRGPHGGVAAGGRTRPIRRTRGS